MHSRRRHRFSHVHTHTNRILTYAGGSPRRVAFYIFIPRSPFFPPTDRLPRGCHPLRARRAGERTSTQSATLLLSLFNPPPANPFTPAAVVARHPRCGDGISHSKRPPLLLVAFSYSPRRSHPPAPGASERPGARISARNIKHRSCVELHILHIYIYTSLCMYARARGLGSSFSVATVPLARVQSPALI